MRPARPIWVWRFMRSAATLTALLAGAAAAADDPGQRAQVEQKIRLASRLIMDSPAAQRITGSGNLQALANLNEGRVHHALAQESLARGDLAGASRQADEALRQVGLARRLVPDAAARQAAARQRHEELRSGIERLIDAWRARVEPNGQADSGDLTAALGLVGTARQQAREGRYEEANQQLLQAEGYVLAGMNRTLHAATLDYTVRPAGAAEEFQNELTRHQALADLLPLAIRELKPHSNALALVERYAGTSRNLQALAVQQALSGHASLALDHIRDATIYMQRALLAAGLVAPQPTGNPP